MNLKIAISVVFAACLFSEPGVSLASFDQPFEALRVAHSGGAVEKRGYTNSYQALEGSATLGFRYFELDFVFTSDGHLVCLHDWEDNFKRTFGFETDKPLTLSEFEALASKHPKYTNCTLEGLATWMAAHPESVIVTDVRGSNLKALRQIGKTLPNARQRVIPQIYKPANHDRVKKLGFDQVIWTLYRYGGTDQEVIQQAEQFEGRFAIAMPTNRARSPLPSALAQRGIPTYVHTVNNKEARDMYLQEYGVTEIYTNRLAPSLP